MNVKGFSASTPVLNGQAYVYPAGMHGQKLSSGEVFRHDRLTGGHPTIAMGTVVRVTYLRNRKGIDVMINDRTGITSSSILLTGLAAGIIETDPDGGSRVRIEIISTPEVQERG